MPRMKLSLCDALVLTLFFALSCSAAHAGDLHNAITNHDLVKVTSLLKDNPAAVNTPDDDYFASLPIDIAAGCGDTNILALLLERGAFINSTNRFGMTPLHVAAARKQLGAAEFLVSKGANVNAPYGIDKDTPLHFAADAGHEAIVQLLLTNGAILDQPFDGPLFRAIPEGHESIVRLLLAHGADVNNRDSLFGATPLISACAFGRTNVVKVLLDNKADINAQTKGGLSPLMQASRNGHFSIVQLLLERKANVNLETKKGETALDWALNNDAGEAYPEIADLLRQHGATKGTPKQISIHEAVKSGDLAKVGALLSEHPEQVNATLADGSASLPIHIAAENDDTKMLALLLQYGAKLEATNKSGFTALHSAAFVYPHLNAARFLVLNGADVNANHAYKTMTPLHFAAESGNVELVQLLLDHGAITTQTNESPLNRAAKEGHEAVVRILIARKADVNAKDSIAQATPLIMAASRGWTNVIRTLLTNNADINAQTKNGYTALMQAARYARKDVVKQLLEFKPDLNLEDDRGRTALGWATQNNSGVVDTNIVELLKQYGAMQTGSGVRRTSIHEAAGTGDLSRVKTLLSQKPGLVSERSSLFGDTPLHDAAGAGNLEICKFLLEAKADVNAPDNTKATPLHAAAKGGHWQIVKLLLENKADPSVVDAGGRTVLHMSAWGGNTNVIQALLKHGVDFNAKEKNGSTALDIANFLGRRDAAALLRTQSVQVKPGSSNTNGVTH